LSDSFYHNQKYKDFLVCHKGKNACFLIMDVFSDKNPAVFVSLMLFDRL